MKIAVLADIHANYQAFRACVDDAIESGAGELWLLGDYAGDLAGVRETMSLINSLRKEFPCVFIRGNKEDYWLGDGDSRRDWRYGNDATGTMLYTYNNLTPADLSFFAGLPISTVVKKRGLPPVMLCHGRPDTNRRSMKNDVKTRDIMDSAPAPIIICGHTHERMTISHNGKLLLNAGSVGVSFDAKKAEYVLLESDGGEWKYAFKALDYDIGGAIRDMYDNKLDEIAPCWTRSTIAILNHGKPKKPTVVDAVTELCRARYGEMPYSSIPADCWADAMTLLEIE